MKIISKLSIVSSILIVLLFSPLLLFSSEQMIHLHIDNINTFYKNINNNKVFSKVKTSRNWNNFKNSKLYIRLSNDIKNLDASNKILNFKNIEKLPNGSLDFYLINIADERFIAKIKLEKSQVSTLINLDFDKLEAITYLDKKIYKYQKVLLVLDDDYLYLSNDLNSLKSFLKNSNDFNTGIRPNSKYRDYLYINLEKIKKTPYLRNYWFTKIKNFSDFKEVTIRFNLTDKLFQEQGIISLKNDKNYVNNLKVIDNKFKIVLFNNKAKFKVNPFLENKDIEIYSMVTNDFNSKVYLGKYLGKNSFKNFLKTLSPSAKILKDKLIEYHYGLMNRKIIYIKLVDGYVLFSKDNNLLKTVKLKDSNNLYQKIEISNFKDISSELRELAELDTNNYSYNVFLGSYLLNYLKVKYFKYSANLKENKKLEFNTKIIF